MYHALYKSHRKLVCVCVCVCVCGERDFTVLPVPHSVVIPERGLLQP